MLYVHFTGISAILLCSALALAAGNQCPSEQETNWDLELLLRHEDCEKFYKCTFGEPVEQICPSGLFFNLELWQCDWQHHVNCTDRNVPGEEKPKPEPEVEEEVTLEPELEEEVAPEPEVEEEVESEPELPKPEPEVVPQPEPEVEEEVTEPEVDVEEVVPEPEVEEEIVPESEEDPEIEFLENGCPVKPHVHWLLPHENDCNLFYYCVWGEKVQRQCPSSLHFNRDLQVTLHFIIYVNLNQKV